MEKRSGGDWPRSRGNDNLVRGFMARTHAAAGGLKGKIVHHAVMPREKNRFPCGYMYHRHRR